MKKDHSVSENAHSQLNFEILEEAANWFAHMQLDQVSNSDINALKAWLDQNPAHQQAWTQVEKVSQRFQLLQKENKVDVADEALSKLRQNALNRRSLLRSLLVLLTVSGSGWLSWRYTSLPLLTAALSADYRTGVGEITDIKLADGSHIWLNTDSAVNVRYQNEQRRLHLVQGEILIQTADDVLQRPFIVECLHGEMQALGTRFEVYQMQDKTRLTVYEGRVSLQPSDTTEQQIINSGELAEFNNTHIQKQTIHKSATSQSRWIQRVLVVNNWSLETVLNELSRYRHGHLGVDPHVADLSVVGTFPLDDTDKALQMLAASLPIRIQFILPWWVSVLPID